jgi:Glu-tRNA(Gln) amidotransferase subunit E-like FAD-binding protein
MGASRTAGANLLGFLRDAAARGPQEALRAIRFERLVGKPIEELFLGLAEYVCPDGGTIDDGIAREAYMETIADLAEAGVTDIDELTLDQVQTIFELYAANAIEARIYNDIGTNVIQLPQDAREVLSLQTQLHEFILRSVSDAMTQARDGLDGLTRERSMEFVTRIYEQAFGILQSLGEAEIDR